MMYSRFILSDKLLFNLDWSLQLFSIEIRVVLVADLVDDHSIILALLFSTQLLLLDLS